LIAELGDTHPVVRVNLQWLCQRGIGQLGDGRQAPLEHHISTGAGKGGQQGQIGERSGRRAKKRIEPAWV
jgi:hypothetical protein